MFNFVTKKSSRNCDGSSRRDFLKVGSLGLSGLSLAHMMQSRAEAAKKGISSNNKSVVWLWLSGGPTHVETFNPNMTAPSEYRSVTGEVKTNLPGVTLGGNFEKMAQVADKMAFFRSFAHTNSGRSRGRPGW